MSNSLSNEIDGLFTIIELMTQSTDPTTKQWPAVALMAALDTINEYWEIVESDSDNDDGDRETESLAYATIDAIYETIQHVLTRQELPMTEEQRQAQQDQEIAEFRNQIEAQAEQQGIRISIQDLDKKIQAALEEGYLKDDRGPKPDGIPEA